MNQTNSAIKKASSPLPFRSPQSAFDVVEPELVEALSRVSEQLNLLVEQSLNDATPADALIKKLSSQLDEVAGVFSLLGLSVAADLSLQLAQAVERVYQAQSNEDGAITAREYEALFQCVYLLPRFFEYVQTTGVASPLLLAPCFYALASAGLSAFVSESTLIEFDYQLNDLIEASNKPSDNELLVSAVPDVMELTLVPLTDPEDEIEASNGKASNREASDSVVSNSEMNNSEMNNSEAAVTQSATIDTTEEQQKTFRRLRQMYQTALIGLLRDSDVGAKLVLIDRVAERAIDLCEGSVNASVWRLVKKLVSAFNSETLELTPQRRHFFSKFDRSLKRLEKDPLHGMHSLPDSAVLAELTLLLLLAEPQNVNDEDLNQLGQFTPLPWNDKALMAHREAMERSTYKALLSMLDVVKDELLGAKRILDMMSESGLCEADDINILVTNCERISAVLKVSGYVAATAPIDQSIEQINSWRIESPDQEALLNVANMILYIENALLTGSLLESVDSQEAQSTVAKGLLQQAQMNLYEESKSNIGLAKRAVIAYIDSNYDREHIANVGVCLESIGGAFSIMSIENAEILMNRCAVLLNAAYQGNSNEGTVDDWLERLADALVSVEYLLEELAAGRAVDNMVGKLIDDSVLALQ